MASNTTTMKRDPYADLPPVPSFTLESSLVADGETMAIAQRGGTFGGDHQDSSPDLGWSEFPNETQSFIVTMYDPDAPTPSGFWRWAVINIRASVTSLSAGAGDGDQTLSEGSTHLPNDASLRRYIGAGPPPGDPPHRYFIVVSALDIPEAGVPATATPALALFHTRANIVARAMLVPVYGA
jgi:Raf kinase inhibitor-like YbhB/YbcL family protein